MRYDNDSPLREGAGNRVRGTPASGEGEPLNPEQKRIRKWLRQVRFKRAIVGGVRESDVWKKLSELNELYESALCAERMRFDALLAEARHASDSRDDEEREAGDDGYE